MTEDTDHLATKDAAKYLGISPRHFLRRYAQHLEAIPGPDGVKYYKVTDLASVRPVARVRASQPPLSPPDSTSVQVIDSDYDRALVREHIARVDAERDRAIRERDAYKAESLMFAERAALAERQRDALQAEVDRQRTRRRMRFLWLR